MKDQKKIVIFAGAILSASLIAAAFTALLMTVFYNHAHFQILGTICQDMIEEQPESEQTVLTVLKAYKNSQHIRTGETMLQNYGYHPTDFLRAAQRYSILLAAIGFLSGSFLLLLAFWYWHRKEVLRIGALSDYLEKVNTGSPALLCQTGEDEYSKLQDEIYKTVTMLYQTRDSALESKNNFARNLSNIAHQLKTPITSISLSLQMMKQQPDGTYLTQIQRQLSRLNHLEEALLLLSRMDAGALVFEKKSTDVFTLLTLAADNLSEVSFQSDVSIHIPEMGEMEINADLDWTMEAIMNLLKNCMEHTPPGGNVYSSYTQNPLYTEILIWDEGQGFAKEDIPHLFERFYRGQNAASNGIGIGLSLAKEIIERQNGTIRAKNRLNGGACFELRFYSH